MNLLYRIGLIVTVLVGALAGTSISLAQEEETVADIGYIVCDWGLVVIHPDLHARLDALPEITPEATEAATIEPEGDHYITITSPLPNAAVALSGFTVTGTGKGLFEGALVVQVKDAAGEIIFQQPLTMFSDEVGGKGDWSADVVLDQGEAGQAASVYAFSTSAKDGSVRDEAEAPVVFSPQAAEFNNIFFVDASDPILQNEDVCGVAETQATYPGNVAVEVTSVMTLSTRSIPPQVQVIVTANLPSGCAFPLRAYKTQDGENISISLFFFLPADAGCGSDLVQNTLRLPLGEVSIPAATITVNGITSA
jgi:hypothetical protein